MTSPTPKVRVSKHDREHLAMPYTVIIKRKAEEFFALARGKDYSGKGLIGADMAHIKNGFATLTQEQFDQYNLAQVWVERRHIPRALDGRVPVKDATVIDLGCGPGMSTTVLSYFADPSWTIVGYDLTPEFVQLARARGRSGHYVNRAGQPISPRFVCQSISTPFKAHEESDELLASNSVDFAVSGGVVGLYLDRPAVFALAAELLRVLKPGACAAIDTGPAVRSSLLREAMQAASKQNAAKQGNGSGKSQGYFVEVSSVGSFPLLEPRPKRVFEKRI